MRRSKAFILSEILMTILLQAGLILVLCMSFYLFLDFYTRTQQILTARNHAERVIQFMDDKIRNAGLGLWKCENPTTGVVDSATIRERMRTIHKLKTKQQLISDPKTGYRLPVSLSWAKDGLDFIPEVPKAGEEQPKIFDGNVVVLFYAQKLLSSSGEAEDSSTTHEAVMVFNVKDEYKLNSDGISANARINIIDPSNSNKKEFYNTRFYKTETIASTNIERWAVAEAIGIPFYINDINYPNLSIKFYGYSMPDKIEIPKAGELMYLKFIQMFTHEVEKENNRQFAFRELADNGQDWNATDGYNQEEDVLEIYMTLDTTTNIFTLYVLASGGDNPSGDTKRPEAWPNKANPRPDGKDDDDEITDEEAAKAWDSSEYCNHVVYVARKSWKLNNIPENFKWN